jgi:predicted nucleic acid-binding protein
MPARVSKFAAGTALPPTIYVDANIIVASVTPTDRWHRIASTFFLETLKQKCKLWISTLTLDESLYNIIRLLHAGANVQYNPKNGAHNAKYAPHAQALTNRLFAVSSTELYVPKDPKKVVDRAMEALNAQQLAPRDSFHLAHALEGGIEAFATLDSDFDNLPLPNENLTVVRLS